MKTLLNSTLTIGSLIFLFATSFLIFQPQSGKSQGPQYSYTGSPTTANTIPFATAATSSNKRQWVYYPSNFTGAPAGMITKIYIKASALVNPSFTGFLIRIGTTTLSTFPSTTFVTSLDTALYAPSISFTGVTGNWIPMQLTNPWFYDGVSNFIIEASHQGYSTGFSVMQITSGVTARSVFGNSANAAGSLQDRLAELGFDIQPGSSDIGLEGFTAPADTICEGIAPVVVTLKNFGPNALGTAKIGWKVNNAVQTTFNWSGNLAANSTVNVTIGSFPFVFGTSYAIEAYCFNPNGGNDTIHGNDTILKPEVIVRAAPTFAFSPTTHTICQGDSVQITGTFTGVSPWNFKIFDGTATQTITNYAMPGVSQWVSPTLTSTWSVFQISDATGCVRNDTSQVQVLVSLAPPAAITPVGSGAACLGDSVSLMASVGLNFTYAWYKNGVQVPGAQSYVFHSKEAGNFTVQVTSPNGCKNTSSPFAVIIHPLPVVNLGNDTVLLPGQNLPLNVGSSFASYLWSNGSTIPMVTIDSTGTGIGVKTVWVVVTDNNGCKGSDTLKINFTNNPGIGEPTEDQQVRISPNPSNGITEIRFNTALPGPVQCEIYSQDGRKVFELNGEPGAQQFKLDLHHLANGQYLIKLTSGTWISAQKLLIIRE